MAAQEIKVPDIGDDGKVEVIEVVVSAGDSVEEEETLIILESDKATLEVPTPTAGTIIEITVKEGDQVGEGDVIAKLDAAAGEAPAAQETPKEEAEAPKEEPKEEPKAEAPAPQPASKPAPKPAQPAAAQPAGSQLAPVDEAAFSKAHASPSVRKFARELGVDLGQVQGSGRKGRITQDDVKGFVKAALQGGGQAAGSGFGLPAQPDIDFSKFGEVETVELERIRKISGKHVHKNWLLIPHVTQFDEADVTEMEAFRQAHKKQAADQGVKLTPLAFLLKASAAALKKFPDLNSSLAADGEHLIHKKYCHIGVAMDTPHGLVMPVVRDVDQKGIYELAQEVVEISGRAREGKLKPNEMQGACFSISSLGGIGGTAFTPIVNSPEVAMLGVSRQQMKPVWNGEEFVPRLMLPLSLSYDHRVIDGAAGARITGYLSKVLGDLRTLLL